MIRSLAFAAALLFPVSGVFAGDAEPAPEPPPVVKATDGDTLKGLAGKPASVEGRITRIGATTSGGITFINFEGSAGFVAVVFKANYEAFPDGFDKYKDQTVRVTGPVTIYKETTPQVVVKSPDQIKVIAAEPAPSATPK